MDFVWDWGVNEQLELAIPFYPIPSHPILFSQNHAALSASYLPHHISFPFHLLHEPHPSTLTNYYMTQPAPQVYKIPIYHFVSISIYTPRYPYPSIIPRPDRIDLVQSQRKSFNSSSHFLYSYLTILCYAMLCYAMLCYLSLPYALRLILFMRPPLILPTRPLPISRQERGDRREMGRTERSTIYLKFPLFFPSLLWCFSLGLPYFALI
jgi:hypothetical protein